MRLIKNKLLDKGTIYVQTKCCNVFKRGNVLDEIHVLLLPSVCNT